MDPVIILFAKAPIPGRVKTRLISELAPDEAAELHEAFVRDTLATLLSLGSALVELHTDMETDAWRDLPVARRLQCAGELGERMLFALESALAEGRPRVMIAGADSPTAPAGLFAALLASDADVALGPSIDGGFFSICCRRVHPKMFAGIPWSSPRTLEATLQALRACGLTVDLGESWYDVDTSADLRHLSLEKPLPPATAGWFLRRANRRGTGPEHASGSASTWEIA